MPARLRVTRRPGIEAPSAKSNSGGVTTPANRGQGTATWLRSTAGFSCLPSCADKGCRSDAGLVTWPREVDRGFGRASRRALPIQRRSSKAQAAAVDARGLVKRNLRGARAGPVGRRSNTRLPWSRAAPARALASGMSRWGSCMRFGWDGWTWSIDGEAGEGVGPKEVEIGQMDCSQRFIRWGRGSEIAARCSCGLEVEKHKISFPTFLFMLDITLTLYLQSPLLSNSLLVPVLNWCNGFY